MSSKQRAPRNRTLTLTEKEYLRYEKQLVTVTKPVTHTQVTDTVIHQDLFSLFEFLPPSYVDLMFIDPPYNLRKNFKSNSFNTMSSDAYTNWVDSWLSKLLRILKPTASVYICGDWNSSGAIRSVAEKYFIIRNRITWEREKGRSARKNWKNSSEDIWYCTVSNDYYFDLEAVKLKRKVLAPYTSEKGQPKDWERTLQGNYRLTAPSNIWTDLTIPFWSMPENTEHPTQKPEKLLAKIILASSRPGDLVFDPFSGSGTTAAVAKKLGRHFSCVEIDSTYACLTLKRVEFAAMDTAIQGYSEGVFWERNSLKEQHKSVKTTSS